MIIRLSGGLGNQMFQYAFGRKLSMDKKEKMYLDIRSFSRDKLRDYELNKYTIMEKAVSSCIRSSLCNLLLLFERKVCRVPAAERILRLVYEEEAFVKQEEFVSDAYLAGYWQNATYFEEIRDALKQELRYTGRLTGRQENLLKKIKENNSVAMHIRRGDYLNPEQSKMYVNVPKDYYERAIHYIESLTSGIMIYVFSDDIEWCRDEFGGRENTFFIDSTVGGDQHIDFELMRNCSHFVMANSTFSWWAAWLCDNPDKIVVGPKNWYVDEGMNRKAQKALLQEVVLL